MDTHGIDVFDGADDNAVVRVVADDLHFVLLPTEDGLLDKDLTGRRQGDAVGDDALEFHAVVGDAATGAAQGERWTDDQRQPDLPQHAARLVDVVGDPAGGAFEADAFHGLPELQPVFGLGDDRRIRPDHLHPKALERARGVQGQRRVEGRLPAHGRQQGIRALALDDLFDDLGRDRFDIRGIGHARVGHDRRWIGVDQDDPVTLLLERLARLGAGIVELARLADHDRTGADDQD